jgi:outer membrane protein assembly factor BamE (lipoprotein component of BamABCDE complex)
MKKLGILFICFLALTACTSLNKRGKDIDAIEINNIKILETNKDKVLEKLGSPTISGDYSNRWYYVSRLMKTNILNQSKTLSQKILIIDFNSRDIVSDVKFLEEQNIKNINIVKDKTTIQGTDKHALVQYINNLGKFGKKAGKKRK